MVFGNRGGRGQPGGIPGYGGQNPRPLNAPSGIPPSIGITPGQSPGVIIARQVIVFGPSDGIFVYSGTPAHGNPPIFWVSNSTTDPFGNTITPTAGVAGTAKFWAGNSVISPTGFYTYSGTPAPGNPPIFWVSTSASDPFGNTVTPTAGVAGTGVFTAGDTRLTPLGEFVYSGTPAAGNLIASIASTAGANDGEGNAFDGGVTGYQVVPLGVFAGTHGVSLTKTSGVLLGGNWPAVTFHNDTNAPFAPPFVGGQSSSANGSVAALASGEDTSSDVQSYLYLASQDVAAVTNGTASLQAGDIGIGVNGTLTVNDNGFKVTLQGSGGATANLNVDANGVLQMAPSFDTNTYKTGHKAYTASAVNITSTSFATVLSMTGLGTAGDGYHIHGYAIYHRTTAAGTPQFSWGAAGSGLVVAAASGYQQYLSNSAVHANNGSLGQANGPVFSGAEEVYVFDVNLSLSTGGTLTIVAAEGTSGDSWTVDSIFAMVEPY